MKEDEKQEEMVFYCCYKKGFYCCDDTPGPNATSEGKCLFGFCFHNTGLHLIQTE